MADPERRAGNHRRRIAQVKRLRLSSVRSRRQRKKCEKEDDLSVPLKPVQTWNIEPMKIHHATQELFRGRLWMHRFQEPVCRYLSAHPIGFGGQIDGIADSGKLDAQPDVIDKASRFLIGQ